MPNARTPRELLLTALERRRLTGFRASNEVAWVVFPPRRDGGATLAVLHIPRSNTFRVVSSETSQGATGGSTTLGDFRTGDAAAACVEDALSPGAMAHEASANGNGIAHTNGAAPTLPPA